MNLVFSPEDIRALWCLGVTIAAFFVVLVIHIINNARRDRTEIDLISKILSLTKTGNCGWSITEDDHDWTVFTCVVNGKTIEFIPSPVCGKMCVDGLYPPIELGFREKRNLEKAIRVAGFNNKVADERKRERIARKEQLNQVANEI